MIHVGVLSPVTGGSAFGEVLGGIVREVAAAGGRVSLMQTLDAGRTGDEVVPAPDVSVPLGWDTFDGFIAIAEASSASYLQQLRASGRHVVLVSNDLDLDAATVAADSSGGVRAGVAHLVRHGHTRIAFVGNLTQTDTRGRYDAYRAALVEHGLAFEDGFFIPTRDHIERGGREAAPLVAQDPRVTAVVTSTDRIALGLMPALVAMGVRVPDDVAVVGFGDVEEGRRSVPPLASVNQNVAGLGATAAALLLAELRGEDVEHNRHITPSTFRPRGSCGCGTGDVTISQRGVDGADRLVDTVGRHLGLRDGRGAWVAGHGAELDAAGLKALDVLIEDTLLAIYPSSPPPEAMESFTETAVHRFTALALHLSADGLPGGRVIERCVARVMVLLSRQLGNDGLRTSAADSASLAEQYDVGMGALTLGDDPSQLGWLTRFSSRLACFGTWDGDPAAGLLRISGLHDPDGAVTGLVPPTCRVEEFPPPALLDHAAHDQVLFIVPVRGASREFGLLAVQGPVDSSSGTGWATYSHWAALLGVALEQQSLVEHLRRSEERYSLAATATHDGLWDWDIEAGTCSFSDRCESIGVEPLTAGGSIPCRREADLPSARTGVELDPKDPDELTRWMRSVHPADVANLRLELRRAVLDRQPFEVEHRMKAPGDGYRWVLCRGLPVAEPDGSARRVVGSLSDIHPRKELEARLREGALHDALTGLPNRRHFLDRLSQAVEAARGSHGTRFSVIFIDLDGFKLINDSLGHLMGDQLLKTVAQRLESDLRSVDTAARLGGDEFAVLLSGLRREVVVAVVERIQDGIAAPVPLAGHDVLVTASVGIASSESCYTDGEDVLRDADIAMFHAKASERGTFSEFAPAMHERATGRLAAQSALRTALREEQFVVHYQPLVQLDGAALTQFEALVRWQHPQRGLLLPGEFLPVMAETGTIVPLGEWIIDAVCAQLASWRATHQGRVAVSVNLSHREFWSERLLVTVTQALLRHRVPAACLVLEITESVIMSEPEAAQQIMADLNAAGIRLHIDDFGTGHSSLHALRAFPVDAFKIDKSFVEGLGIDQQPTDLMRIIVAMGRTLGIAVVAEGVETQAQADQLRSMGCGTVQGWLYAHAVPGSQAATMLGRPLTAEASVGSETHA
jgi:diguanylate cyclase (GGDEF)-like protein